MKQTYERQQKLNHKIRPRISQYTSNGPSGRQTFRGTFPSPSTAPAIPPNQ